MNISRFAHASPLLLTVLLALGGCVLAGTLDEAATESDSDGSSDEADGSTAATTGATSTNVSASGLGSSGGSVQGDFSCAAFEPEAYDCEPQGTARAFVGYGNDVKGPVDDTPCTITDIEDKGELGQDVDFECPTGSVNLFIDNGSPAFALPFIVGQSTLLTVRAQADSVVVRSLGGELLMAYVSVRDGFVPNVDLGTIEIVPGRSGCPANPLPAEQTACSAGGAVATQRIPLKVASAGPTGPSVFGGHSAVFEDNGRSFLLIVEGAEDTVCWDLDCPDDLPLVNVFGAMAFLLVAQPG